MRKHREIRKEKFLEGKKVKMSEKENEEICSRGNDIMNRLYIAGIGPGGPENMTRRAYDIVREAELVVGYTVYNDHIMPLP